MWRETNWILSYDQLRQSYRQTGDGESNTSSLRTCLVPLFRFVFCTLASSAPQKTKLNNGTKLVSAVADGRRDVRPSKLARWVYSDSLRRSTRDAARRSIGFVCCACDALRHRRNKQSNCRLYWFIYSLEQDQPTVAKCSTVSPAFWTKTEREVLLFLEIPEFR